MGGSAPAEVARRASDSRQVAHRPPGESARSGELQSTQRRGSVSIGLLLLHEANRAKGYSLTSRPPSSNNVFRPRSDPRRRRFGQPALGATREIDVAFDGW